jgi:GDPmannose 4,6-dehydratase
LLSAAKQFADNKIKFYFAGTSEMFGKVLETPQNENTPFNPRSSYGISKVTAYHMVKNYREAYNLHASSGILFNHESPRRGFEFVTRKISYGVARIKKGLQKKLILGNMKAKRDWGHAKDYVEGMWLMLQQEKPDDFVIGTGKEHSVEDFAKKAFAHVGLDFKDYVVSDKNLFRPAEVDTLLADSSKAEKILKWKPKIQFDDLVINMVEHDLKQIRDF